MNKKPDADILLKLIKSGMSGSEIGRMFGVKERSGREWAAEARSVMPEGDKFATPKMIMGAIRSNIRAESVEDIAPLISKATNDSVICVLSDWHIGSTVRDINGDYLYNIKIAAARAKKMCEKTLKIIKFHAGKSTNIDEVHVFVLGDMVDGEGIYDGQEFQLEQVPPQQVMSCFKVLDAFIQQLKKSKLRITISMVKGNHGHAKDSSPQSNWDLMLYMILKNEYQDDKQVMVNFSETDFLNTTVKGWKFHLRHRGIGQSETAAGRAKVGGWASLHDAHAVVCGHLHHFSLSEDINRRLIMCGSLKGNDDFSDSIAKGCKPSQLVFGVSKEHMQSFIYIVEMAKK